MFDSFSRPAIQRSKVVLPQPDGPKIAVIPFAGNEVLISSTNGCFACPCRCATARSIVPSRLAMLIDFGGVLSDIWICLALARAPDKL